MRNVNLMSGVTFATLLLLCLTGCGGGGEAREDPAGQGGGKDSTVDSARGAAGAPSEPQREGQANSASAPAAPPGEMVSGHASGAAAPAAEGLPPGHPPVSAAGGPRAPGAIIPPPPGSGQGASGMAWIAPAGWKEERPGTPMRRSQFRVPRAQGDPEDGECAVFYFGPGQGGTPESNASRWVNQFHQPDGSSSEGKAKIAMRSVNGNDVMFVEVKGTYVGMAMPGAPEAAPKPGHALLGAIVPGPDAPWFFKFTGPAKTVEANRAAFEALIASVSRGARS